MENYSELFKQQHDLSQHQQQFQDQTNSNSDNAGNICDAIEITCESAPAIIDAASSLSEGAGHVLSIVVELVSGLG